MTHAPHEKIFHGNPHDLFSKERLDRLEIKRVVQLALEGGNFETLLDIGTGSGLFALAFAQRGLHVTGLDINDAMLEMAKKIVPAGTFLLGDADRLPFADKTFDIAFMGHLLHETNDPHKTLKEARRVAKERVVVLEWPYVEEEVGPPLAHRLKQADLEKAAQKAGYSDIQIFPTTHMVVTRLTV